MKYAIISIQGKQHKVQPGDQIVVDQLTGEVGTTIDLEQVLMTVDGDTIALGTPYLSAGALQAKIVDHLRGEKIRVAKFKSKSRYRRVKGHRQYQTKLEIIEATSKKSTKSASSTK